MKVYRHLATVAPTIGGFSTTETKNVAMETYCKVFVFSLLSLLDDRGVGVRVPIGSRIFSSPRRPDRFWGPPSLLSNGYRGKTAGALS
jgi:hypothetical protein